jgi:hypothetical protein
VAKLRPTDVGGYIEIFGGQSGNAAGGTLYIQGGYGRTGGDANVSGGFGATGPGGDVSIIGGGSANGQAEYGNVIVATGSKNWTFDNTGNLVLPSGTPSINYANGDPFSGGAVNTGNVTFDDNIVIGTGDEYGFSGLYLAIGDASAANLQYFRVRGGDVPTHLHFDTGNSAYYDQYFGDDGKFVKLEAGDFGNVSIGTQDLGNSYNWTFGNDGNLTLPGNASSINYADGSPFSGAPVNTGNLTFSQSTIESNQSNAYINFNAYSAGDIDVGTNDAKNVVIRTDGSNANLAWTFDAVGNLTLPGNTFAVNYANGDPVTFSGGSGNTGNVTFDDVNIIGTGNLKLQPNPANADAYLDIYLTSGPDIHIAGNGETVILGTDDFANVTIGVDGNVRVQASTGTPYTWEFDNLGKLTFPGTPRIDTADNNFEVQAAESISLEANAVVNIYTDTGGSSYQWQFGDDGNLTLPRGGVVYETNIPDGGLNGNTIALTPSGGSDADQQLLIYPTANDANHLHLTSGNLYNTELYLGSDDFYVKMANTGNIVVNSNDNTGNTALWTFDSSGNLEIPANGYIETPLGSNGNINIHPDGNGVVTISGNTSGALLRVVGDEVNSFNRIEVDTYGDNGNLGGAFTGTFSRGNLSTPQAVLNQDRLALFTAKGYDGSVLSQPAAQITLDAVGNWSPSNHGTHISFLTTPNTSTTMQEVVRIYASGDLHQVIGNIIVDDGVIKTNAFTVSSLPLAANAGIGSRSFVTDADTRTFGNTVVGGAGNAMPVWSDGTNWYIG